MQNIVKSFCLMVFLQGSVLASSCVDYCSTKDDLIYTEIILELFFKYGIIPTSEESARNIHFELTKKAGKLWPAELFCNRATVQLGSGDNQIRDRLHKEYVQGLNLQAAQLIEYIEKNKEELRARYTCQQNLLNHF